MHGQAQNSLKLVDIHGQKSNISARHKMLNSLVNVSMPTQLEMMPVTIEGEPEVPTAAASILLLAQLPA